ncbi:hypothetical protein IKQ21_05515 [bacterium]|nr:hypothetical protein [bacterium]
MTENRFLNYLLTEGVLSILLALSVLILPKVTEVSFMFALSLVLIVYGGYKMTTSFLSRNFIRYYVMEIVSSGILFFTGLVMMILPVIDMIAVVSVLGIYFVLQSISMTSFLCQAKNIINFPQINTLLPHLQLLFGIILIILFSTIWAAGTLFCLNFLITGVMLVNMYITKKLEI